MKLVRINRAKPISTNPFLKSSLRNWTLWIKATAFLLSSKVNHKWKVKQLKFLNDTKRFKLITMPNCSQIFRFPQFSSYFKSYRISTLQNFLQQTIVL